MDDKVEYAYCGTMDWIETDPRASSPYHHVVPVIGTVELTGDLTREELYFAVFNDACERLRITDQTRSEPHWAALDVGRNEL